MIARVHGSCRSFTGALSEAFGRALAADQDLTGDTVLAHSSSFPVVDGGQPRWTSKDVVEHLAVPARRPAQVARVEHPFVFHVSVRLRPGDRVLAKTEWSEIAYRLARTTGIAPPGDDKACRWIALQPQPGRLHLLANLIREDGTRARQPRPLHTLLLSECHRIDSDLRLRAEGASADGPQSGRDSPAVADAAQAALLRRLAEEANGPLANVRRLVEQAAHQVANHHNGRASDAGHRLEWAARRLFALQQDLQATAASLDQAAQRPPAASEIPVAMPAARAHRSR
ncbi:relaxase/mobilization nuclease [Streptomyces sp. NPDC002536]